MATCLNCSKKLSCGCQQRKASDGKSCCTNCLSNYESKLKIGKVQQQPAVQPKNPNVWGNDRYK
jgi:hypothetical protein